MKLVVSGFLAYAAAQHLREATPYLTISADDQSLCPTDARTGGYTNGDG
jgi:hypothetical protein